MRRSSYFFDVELNPLSDLQKDQYAKLKAIAATLSSNVRLIARVTTAGDTRYRAMCFSIPMELINGCPNKIHHGNLSVLWDEIGRYAPRDGSGLFVQSSLWAAQDRVGRVHPQSSTRVYSPS